MKNAEGEARAAHARRFRRAAQTLRDPNGFPIVSSSACRRERIMATLNVAIAARAQRARYSRRLPLEKPRALPDRGDRRSH